MKDAIENEEVQCQHCQILWKQISRDENELYKMKKHPKIYGKIIAMLEADNKRRYELVGECRRKNHPDVMY